MYVPHVTSWTHSQAQKRIMLFSITAQKNSFKLCPKFYNNTDEAFTFLEMFNSKIYAGRASKQASKKKKHKQTNKNKNKQQHLLYSNKSIHKNFKECCAHYLCNNAYISSVMK
jgi:hypothetical protein